MDSNRKFDTIKDLNANGELRVDRLYYMLTSDKILIDCSRCSGKGEHRGYEEDYERTGSWTIKCSYCNGSGKKSISDYLSSINGNVLTNIAVALSRNYINYENYD